MLVATGMDTEVREIFKGLRDKVAEGKERSRTQMMAYEELEKQLA